MRHLIPFTWALVVLSLGGCQDYSDDIAEVREAVEEPQASTSPSYSYASVCFMSNDGDCSHSGTDYADFQIDCVGTMIEYWACVADEMDDLGQAGWYISLGEDTYPAGDTMYLMVRED